MAIACASGTASSRTRRTRALLRVADKFSDSNTGRERRANEDSYFVSVPVFVVADGMGGAQAGEVASRTAVEQFSHGLPPGDGSPEERLAMLVREANERIYALSQSDAQRAGMGTTLTAAYVGDDEVAIAHVGDSRAYVLRDGRLERLTDDHSLVDELRRQGRLTEEEAEEHPQRSIITRALGPEPDVDVDRLTFRARNGDVFLLCSDGLTAMVREKRVAEIITGAPDLTSAGRALIRAANAAGGRDNITVILFSLEEVGAAGTSDGARDQATMVGVPAAEVNDALARRRGGGDSDVAGVAAAVAPAGTPSPVAEHPGPVARRLPRMPARSAAAHRRRLPRVRVGLVVLVVLLALIVAGAWVASQTVYFVGTNADGLITVYRGVPYELPAGVHLYSTNFVSGVDAASLSTSERHRLLDHTWRSHDDATNLVRQLELGKLATP
jgi:serine/threonine protein phosphatase PrpC